MTPEADPPWWVELARGAVLLMVILVWSIIASTLGVVVFPRAAEVVRGWWGG